MSSTNAKRNKNLPVLVVAALILIVLVVGIIYELIHMNTPSAERADLGKIYPVSEGSAVVISNGVLSETRAVWEAKRAYLDLSIVQKELNSRFYWDSTEKLLVVTTASEVATAASDTIFEGGPVFLNREDTIYVSLDYVAQYTNIQVDSFSNPNRVFLRTQWGESTRADVAETAQVRTEADVKSPILTDVEPGSGLLVMEQGEDWDKVYTKDGYVGYISKEDLKDVRTETDEGPSVQPEYTRTTLDQKVFLVWHQVFEESGVNSLDSLLADAKGLNVLAPTWFSIKDEEGNLESRANHDYVQKAHDKGIQIWALVENINIEGVDAEKLLNVTSHRTNLINGLIQYAEEYDLDGINVDLEKLPSSAGEGYIQFIRELSVACRKRGLILSVDNYVPSAWTEHYHRAEQGVVADYVIIMAYDEHYNGSEAGSTASVDFVRQGVEDTLKEVPAEKVVTAFPFYTRLWKTEGAELTSEVKSMDEAKALADSPEYTVIWQEELGQNYAEMDQDGTTYQIWLEDEESIKAKLEAVKSFDLAGLAGWKLGMESDSVWDLISNALQS
ncbi:glycosyl hydrolase family 18 protein [Cuneatibacter sp. NSJ-177]|uniref:glycosyl hydrolase family 18 protein n=1 Tax=Cuneatibacter sp. NSJ-177 TaxID=2931401 RepID=UPI001FD21C00|nr:glycosyl hydrolase family 18 protein [Cuneatibacter sp. NSJ-177]MCJ7834658.1 glycosyl hydrolase family 18 protein [Cuneatibacter sp. NSJ-177]